MTEVSNGKPKSFSNGGSAENINGELKTAANGSLSDIKNGPHEAKCISAHSKSHGQHSKAKSSKSNLSDNAGVATKSCLKGIDKGKSSQGNMGCNNTRTVVDPAKLRNNKQTNEQIKPSEQSVSNKSDVNSVKSAENVSVTIDSKSGSGCKTENSDSVFCDQDGSGQGEVIGCSSDSGVNRSRNTSHTSESTNSDTEKAMVPSESASESTEKVFSPHDIAESSDVTDVEETGDDTNGIDSSGVEGGWQNRPHSLSLPKPLQHYERNRHKGSRTFAPGDTSSDEVSVDSDVSSLGSSLHGTIMRKGDMIEFVTENLQEKIRGSRDSSSMGSRTSSIRSISSVNSISSYTSSLATSVSGMSRSPSSLVQHSPDAIPPIDPQAVQDLESHARVVADRVDLMMGNLKANLCKMSAITVGTLDAYKHSVESTCEAVDASIKAMYALMAKCEELSMTVNPVYQLADQIKEIKRLLDLFESQVDAKT